MNNITKNNKFYYKDRINFKLGLRLKKLMNKLYQLRLVNQNDN